MIVQFGGQTPLKLAVPLEKAGVRLLGTSADAIDRAEDRERFDALLDQARDSSGPEAGIAKDVAEAKRIAESIGFPVLVRPSYVLGGRAMMICWSRRGARGLRGARHRGGARGGRLTDAAHRPVPDERHRSGRRLRRGRQQAVIGGVMQHIEEAGVHSGDSTSVLPPYSLDYDGRGANRGQSARRSALELGVVGLMNVQFAVKDREVYVLEVNPTRFSHRAVRVQGHGATAGEDRRQADGRPDASRSSVSRTSRSRPTWR